ncbi:MAG: acetyl-CoA carboxylase biotin carboxyl carrier protein subunit [Armatimonadota bacterium]
MQIDREAVRRVIELLEQSNAGEIEVQTGEQAVRVRRTTLPAAPEAGGAGAGAQGAAAAGAGAGRAHARVAEPPVEYVTAGLVGLFHHGRAPGDEPLVSVGDEVGRGQVIGTIEALRKLTDVVAPCDGVIVEVLVDDGEAVQYGDRLFAIRPEEA